MSFLSGITGASVAPSVASPSKPVGGFLGGISMPTAAESTRAANIANVSAQAASSRTASNQANSIGGIALNTLKGLWPASGIPEQFEQGVAQSKDQTPGAEGTLGRISGIATALSSPLAPVFNPLSKAVNAAGEFLGRTAPAGTVKFAGSPAGIATARVAGDVANAANIAGTALGGYDAVHSFFTPKVKGGFLESTKVPVKSDSAETKIPLTDKTPVGQKPLTSKPKPINLVQASHADYAKAQGYEPYTPHDQLPVIQTGPKADSGLPTIQTQAPKARGVKGDLTVEPIKEPTKPQTGKSPAPLARVTPIKEPAEPTRTMAESTGSKPLAPFSPEKPVGESSPIIKPVEGSGDFHEAGSATSLVAQMTKDGLKEKVGELPGFNSENWEHQGDFAADTVTRLNSHQDTLDMLDGSKPLPHGLLGSAFVDAVKNYVKVTGDGELASAAAKSPLHLQVSRGAQELGYLGHTSEDMDPIAAIRDISKARGASSLVEKDAAAIRSQTPRLTRTLRENAPKKDEWASFIKDITCGL